MSSEKRTAVVTGGASGIGAAVAERLELAGVHVRRVDITPTPSSHVLDVTDEQACHIQTLLDNHQPKDHGIAAPLWTRRGVAELIHKELGITVDPNFSAAA